MDEILFPEKLEAGENSELLLATIGSINSNGATLIFDGQTAATTKRYKVMVTGSYMGNGDRVVVMKHSGTYVILGEISYSGKPGSSYTTNISNIGTASTYFTANYAEYASTGRVAQLRLKGTVSTALQDAWTNLFTIASGKRPLMSRHYFNDYFNHGIQVSDDGTVSAWGLAANTSVDFILTYILA